MTGWSDTAIVVAFVAGIAVGFGAAFTVYVVSELCDFFRSQQ